MAAPPNETQTLIHTRKKDAHHEKYVECTPFLLLDHSLLRNFYKK